MHLQRSPTVHQHLLLPIFRPGAALWQFPLRSLACASPFRRSKNPPGLAAMAEQSGAARPAGPRGGAAGPAASPAAGGGGASAKESVWDYPRPPRLERTSKHLRVLLGGEVVADTRNAYRVLETSHPPTYYFPPSDVNTQLLARSQGGSTFCEWKGNATYWDVTAGGSMVQRGVWSYESPTPGFAPIKGYLAFYPSKFECSVDGEQVQTQEGSYYAGWVTSDIQGPFKGSPGSAHW